MTHEPLTLRDLNRATLARRDLAAEADGLVRFVEDSALRFDVRFAKPRAG